VLVNNEGSHLPWKSIWWTKAPSRVAFFVWSAALGKIFTMDNLRKRHVNVVDKCCMYKKNGESIDYPILYCEVVCTLWSVFSAASGYLGLCLEVDCCSTWSAVMWKMVPTCLLWCIWREMIDKSFEDCKRTLEELIFLFFYALYLWITAFVSSFVLNFYDFLFFSFSFSFFLLLARYFL
jgi:hypothetical protein